MSKTTLLVTTAIVAAGLSAPSFAANTHATTAVKMPAKHLVVPGKKKGPITNTVLNTTSVYGTIAGSTFTSVATQSVTAKKAGTLSMSAMMQFCGFEGEFAPIATDIITEVDGTYVDFGPYQAGITSTDICIIDNWQGIYPVAAGTHTVDYSAYTVGAGAYVGRITERTDVVN